MKLKYPFFTIILLLILNAEGFSQHSPKDNTNSTSQEVTIRLNNGKTVQVKAKYENGTYIYQGDIVLGQDKKRLKGVEYTIGNKWECGIIPYTLNSNLNSVQLSIINEAITQINSNTNLTLKIRSNEVDYVDFISSPTDRCLSKIGRVGQKQEIEISSDGCTLWGRVAHEIYHAAGIWHEHARNDRDNFITIQFNNIDPANWDQFEILSGTQDIGPYDYNSIMHYGPKAFSTNNANTIITPNGELIGNRDDFSSGDISTINSIYNLNGCNEYSCTDNGDVILTHLDFPCFSFNGSILFKRVITNGSISTSSFSSGISVCDVTKLFSGTSISINNGHTFTVPSNKTLEMDIENCNE